jgi:ABC-type phosphate transport system substrate-binding protein
MPKSFRVLSVLFLALTLAACNRNQSAASDPNLARPEVAQHPDAEAIRINGSSTQRTLVCHHPEDTVQVTGDSNLLTVTGDCGSLQVTGHSNNITIDSVRTIQFNGTSNAVMYRSTRRPTVDDQGLTNSVAPATGAISKR